MSWIEFCNYLFHALLLTTITGSIFTVFWMILRKTVLRSDCKAAERFLRITVQTYLLPVIFVVLIVKYGDDSINFSKEYLIRRQIFQVTPAIKMAITVFITAWLAGILATLVFWVIRYKSLHKELKGSIPEDRPEVLEVFEQIKIMLGIRKNITLWRNDRAGTPFTAGIGKKRIVLPFRAYTKSELEIILSHELTHCRYHDLLFKIETVWVNIIHVWNPFAYFARRQMSILTEYVCDVNACTECSALFSVKSYFSVLLGESSEAETKPRYFTMALTESSSSLERRVRNMKNYQKKGALKKSIAAATFICFLLGGSMTAYAAGEGVVSVQSNWYEATRVQSVAENYESTILQEYVILPEDVEDVPTVIVDNGGIEPYATTNINWTIPAGEKWKTSAFTLSSGACVGMTMTISPSNKEVRIGLEYPDGSEHYVPVTGTGQHIFTVPTTGSYHFYIYNTSDTTITATGSYVK